MTPATPTDWLITGGGGTLLALLCIVALIQPDLRVSRIVRRLFASRGMSPTANLILLIALGAALAILALVQGCIAPVASPDGSPH